MIVLGYKDGVHYARVDGVKYTNGDYCTQSDGVRVAWRFNAGVPLRIKYEPLVVLISD